MTVHSERPLRGGARRWGEDSSSPQIEWRPSPCSSEQECEEKRHTYHLGVRSPSGNGLRRMPRVATFSSDRE